LTTTAIRSVPTQLPHASIYLDDLFEIEEIISNELAKLPKPRSASFEYSIDKQISVTTHAELIEHEGSSKDFILHLRLDDESYSSLTLMIGGITAPSLYLPHLLKERDWAVFGRVEQVFRARRDLLKNATDSIPSWVIILPFLWLAISYILVRIVKPPIMQPGLVAAIEVLLFLPVFLGAFGVWKKNRIYFRHIRQDQKARNAALRERIEKLIWLLVGMAIVAIGDRIKR
jgi:hypothetical protein